MKFVFLAAVLYIYKLKIKKNTRYLGVQYSYTSISVNAK